MAKDRGGKASKHRIRNREDVTKALQLRRGGASYEEIGRSMGLSKTRAHQLVMAGLDEIDEKLKEEAAAVRALEVLRLDAIVLAHYNARGNPRNAEILLKASKRRAELLGLDAPQKIAPTTPDGEALPELVRLVLVKPDGNATA